MASKKATYSKHYMRVRRSMNISNNPLDIQTESLSSEEESGDNVDNDSTHRDAVTEDERTVADEIEWEESVPDDQQDQPLSDNNSTINSEPHVQNDDDLDLFNDDYAEGDYNDFEYPVQDSSSEESSDDDQESK